MGRLAYPLSIAIIVVLLFAVLGLAVPSVNLNVQEIGSGSGDVFSPVSTGTVCAYWSYLIYDTLQNRWFGPFLLSQVSSVFGGNFTRDIPAQSNLSVAVYYSSSQISSGSTTLSSALNAGYYVEIPLNSQISGLEARDSEYHLTVQTPEYVSSLGPISISVQAIGIGSPTGVYHDYAVYYTSIGIYDVYIVFRCFELSFTPRVLSGGVVVLPVSLFAESGLGVDKQPECPRRARERCPIRPVLGNIPWLIQKSEYFRKTVLPQILEEVEELSETYNQSEG